MNQYSHFSFPAPILYGPGCLQETGSILERLNMRRVLIICDKFLPETEAYTQLKSVLDAVPHLESVTTFREVHPNPIEADVHGATRAYYENNCDGIIGLGGGSALDVAKVCRLLIKHPDFQLADQEVLFRVDWGTLAPFIALPTTAGTGSEIGRSSVVTLDATGAKSVIFHPKLLADQVILAPELTVSLPAHLTAATGIDALTHCIESYTSPVLQPLCDAIALEGIHLTSKHLLDAVHHGDSLEHRGGMQLAALMGGIAFQKDLGATHSMAHPLSNLCHLHHGLANALCLPTVMRWNAQRKPGLYRRAGQSAGLDVYSLSERDADRAMIEWTVKLIETSGIELGLTKHGVEASQIAALSDLAINDPCHQTNPVPVTREDFEQLYQSAL